MAELLTTSYGPGISVAVTPYTVQQSGIHGSDMEAINIGPSTKAEYMHPSVVLVVLSRVASMSLSPCQ